MATAKFEEDFTVGRANELRIVARWPDQLELLDGKKGDFKVRKNGKVVELKTERRSQSDTPNLAVERWSCAEAKTPGGPWQALAHGAERYCVLWQPDNVLYLYDTAAFVARTEEYLVDNPGCRRFRVVNESRHQGYQYVTEGYLVPRDVYANMVLATMTLA